MAKRSGSGAFRSVPLSEGSQTCEAPNGQRFPWQVFASELVGTALLVWVGLSLVILIFGEGSPIKSALPSEGWRRLVTGFLFGTTGALIVLSPVGMHSGAHINPTMEPLPFMWSIPPNRLSPQPKPALPRRRLTIIISVATSLTFSRNSSPTRKKCIF